MFFKAIRYVSRRKEILKIFKLGKVVPIVFKIIEENFIKMKPQNLVFYCLWSDLLQEMTKLIELSELYEEAWFVKISYRLDGEKLEKAKRVDFYKSVHKHHQLFYYEIPLKDDEEVTDLFINGHHFSGELIAAGDYSLRIPT